MEEVGLLKVGMGNLQRLPEGSQIYGESSRTHNEIWGINDRVLCFQSSPEINKTFVKDLVINKLYDVGKIDDKIKNLSMEQVDDELIPNSRHFILKCIHRFIKTPNEHLVRLAEERLFMIENDNVMLQSMGDFSG